MEMMYSCPPEYEVSSCNACGNYINMPDGFMTCKTCEENFCPDCFKLEYDYLHAAGIEGDPGP